jgi:anti-anti-sigma factor
LAPFESDGVSAIVLDLRELTFIDSVALRSLVRARERAQTNGQQLILVGARPTARRLFELTSTEYMLDDQGAGVLNRSVEKMYGAGAKMPAAPTLVARSRTNVQRDNGGR